MDLPSSDLISPIMLLEAAGRLRRRCISITGYAQNDDDLASLKSIGSQACLDRSTCCSSQDIYRRLTCDNCRVSWVILWDILFNLADEISANISSLGVDATSDSTEEGNGGSTQAIASNGLIDTLPVLSVYLQACASSDHREHFR